MNVAELLLEGRTRHFDAILYSAIPDVAARQTALVTNSLDAVIECDFKTVHLRYPAFAPRSDRNEEA